MIWVQTRQYTIKLELFFQWWLNNRVNQEVKNILIASYIIFEILLHDFKNISHLRIIWELHRMR